MFGVDILALAGASPTALSITDDVLQAANRLSPRRLFDRRVLSPSAPTVALRQGVSVEARPIERARARSLVVVLGLGAVDPAELDARLAEPDVVDAAAWLRKAGQSDALIASSCTGVFVLGEAGLLAGRTCTSTWWLVSTLKARVPSCDATLDAMVLEHDRIWTAGASFAHIDLMLALVARLGSAGLAANVARHLVVEPRASQARFVVPSFLAAQDPLASRLEALVRRRLGDPPGLEELAAKLGLSPRTLSRRIVAATGLPPMKLLQKIRVDAAIHLLQTTRSGVDEIAQEVGFGDASALYRLVLRQTGKSPSAFRGRDARP